MSEDEQVKIIRLDLTPQSMSKWREVHNEHPVRYPVLLKLSRPLDPFELHALKFFHSDTFIPAENDESLLIMSQTTLEEVREAISDLTEQINYAVQVGKSRRDAAAKEDSRMFDLLSEINHELSGD
ncbi:hypothetical protein A5784_12830 [Mycobacterium sp. 852013-50091_SCH5140682]|uniref:hypothetical protein n=1 Tax=Mycobacterium sp. 852013-50091_SCH5140682 TaxID=1834109 RepID=UPI0007EB89F5|nr:hypothetical protein [Mycobacterium sp. 852013-50091_SCH5140682]OBC04454.1 hypothetical protein A5784_12830 [Mycobacterium sp. 852013-50091_SCH5140682]